MKTLLALGLALIIGGTAFYACGQSVNWNTWNWTAPVPPLADTEWLDFGWDSTSNGPPMLLAEQGEQRLPPALPKMPMRHTAAQKEPAPSSSLFNSVTVSPYYTVAFENFNGKAESGVGFDVGLGLSPTMSVVSFIETSDTADAWIDRFGVGPQITGRLGRWLRPYARFSVGYSLDGSSGLANNEIFLRPEFGASIDVYHYKKVSAAVTAAWAVDVDTDGHAAQRLNAGISLKF